MFRKSISKPKAAVSWSGGKDSYLALHRVAEHFNIQALVTMFTEDGARSRSHGLRPEVLARQAGLMRLPLLAGRGSWATYEQEFKRLLRVLAEDGFSHVIFGDIFPDAHKLWAERVCNECGLHAVEPLWGESTVDLFHEFLATSAEAQIVAAKASLLDKNCLGLPLCEEIIPKFGRLGIDPCGEGGEYHTLVVNSPRMTKHLHLQEVNRIIHDGYWLLDLSLNETA